eukprot:1284579-Rhodomonas_salina.2
MMTCTYCTSRFSTGPGVTNYHAPGYRPTRMFQMAPYYWPYCRTSCVVLTSAYGTTRSITCAAKRFYRHSLAGRLPYLPTEPLHDRVRTAIQRARNLSSGSEKVSPFQSSRRTRVAKDER